MLKSFAQVNVKNRK